jgi:hypothetical protein
MVQEQGEASVEVCEIQVRAATAECRIRAPLIEAFHGPFSADDRISL